MSCAFMTRTSLQDQWVSEIAYKLETSYMNSALMTKTKLQD